VVKGPPASLRILVIIKSESLLFGVLVVVSSVTLRARDELRTKPIEISWATQNSPIFNLSRKIIGLINARA